MESSQNKSLVIITPGFPEDEQDTTCLPAVQQFVLAYKNEFPDTSIQIISLHYPYKMGRYNWHGIDIHALGTKSSGQWVTFLTILKAAILALKITRRHNFLGLLSLWLTDTALAGKIISKISGLPHLVWMHGQDAKAGNKYFKLVKPKVEHIAAISDFQNDIFQKSYGIKAAHVIYNGINRELFPPLNKAKRPIDILAAGSLNKIKRYHLIIEVVKYIKVNGLPDIKVVIAGDGELRNQLSELIILNNLSDNIDLIGEVAHASVLELMNNSRLFLHPSSYEGHSTVMLEALYAGCTVLSFIPVSEERMEQFVLCASIEDMYYSAMKILQSEQQYSRVLINDMSATARKVNAILSAM